MLEGRMLSCSFYFINCFQYKKLHRDDISAPEVKLLAWCEHRLVEQWEGGTIVPGGSTRQLKPVKVNP